MHPAALGTLGNESLHYKLLAAPLASGLYAAARDRGDRHSATVGAIDEFYKISTFRERTSTCRSASSAITHFKTSY